MFKDEVIIHVKSGKGGDGCISFRREKYIPKGGPDGGDGGKGADVVFQVDPEIVSLGKYHNRQKFCSENGKPGLGSNKTGASGNDLILRIPKGTIIRDFKHKHILRDLSDNEAPYVFLKGGNGGRGNTRFASSTEQVPRRAEKGFPGTERTIILELKMIADVGIIGLPNAGKSTLLSRISKAKPQVADYPFTTLIPQLGVVEVDYRRFIFADIPGLIEGAHTGSGLGDKFLKHVERTGMLIHLIDCFEGLSSGFENVFHVVNDEIRKYSQVLADKPQIVAVTKAELLSEELDLKTLSKNMKRPVFLISSHTGQGINHLIGAIVRQLEIMEESE